ncbi:MAG: STAS domain-containing protein [Phycisphaerales bacterium]|nr:STAS domain-containing protein [Phycisphaerales bacterium]
MDASRESLGAATYAVSTRLEGATHVVSVTGSIQWEHADEFQDYLPTLINAETPNLVLDFSALKFINSSGLSALLAAHRQAREHGGELRLATKQGDIIRLLHITRVDALIQVHETPEDALAAIA